MINSRLRWIGAALGVTLLLVGLAARAEHHEREEHEHERGSRVSAPLPAYTQECGACHVAYPPYLLNGASWDRLMRGLPKHFGTDASLDAATTKQIADWLAANASQRSANANPPQDRITRTAWFVREHDEVGSATWQRASIKSASNCAACHTRAAEGSFREREIRIPK